MITCLFHAVSDQWPACSGPLSAASWRL